MLSDFKVQVEASLQPLSPCKREMPGMRPLWNPVFCRSHAHPQLTSQAYPSRRQRPQLPWEGAAMGLAQPQELSSCLACTLVISASIHGVIYYGSSSIVTIIVSIDRCRNGNSEIRRLAQVHRAGTQLNRSLPNSGVGASNCFTVLFSGRSQARASRAGGQRSLVQGRDKL